jgi:DNA-binding response OmpR family regulator
MKILVINNDLMERTVIQQVLQVNGHEIVLADNSDAAWKLLHSEEIRFVIADRIGTDIDEQGFIRRVRDARPPYYIYILLITQKGAGIGCDHPAHRRRRLLAQAHRPCGIEIAR